MASAVKKSSPKKSEKATVTPFTEAVGRRKTSSARVRLFAQGTGIVINSRPLEKYFPLAELQASVEAPLKKLKLEGAFSVDAHVYGGGIRGQAEAVRHGIARALVKSDPEHRTRLKRAGYLKRDPRMKERRKYGLKKARRAPQWSKR